MYLFGYRLDKRVALERVTLGPMDKPVYHNGSAVGCLVLHGIGGTPANVRVVTDTLIAAGYTVAAPMIAGHGKTAADFAASAGAAWEKSALDAYDWLIGQGCETVVLIGLSLGGLLSGLLAAEKPVAGLVLICPPVVMMPFLNVSRRISFFAPFVRYEPKHVVIREPDPAENMLSGMATKKLVDLDRLRRRLIRALPELRCPVLAIQAAYDDKVHPRTYEVLRGRLTQAPFTLKFMERSPHGCTYGPEREAVAAHVAEFVAAVVDNIAAAPV